MCVCVCVCVSVSRVAGKQHKSARVGCEKRCLTLKRSTGCLQRLPDMPIRPLCDPAERARLEARGRRYVALASGHHHVEYVAKSFLPSVSEAGGAGVLGAGAGAATRRRAVGGRVMLEQSAFSASSARRGRVWGDEGASVIDPGAAWGFVWEMVNCLVLSDMAHRCSGDGGGAGAHALFLRSGWRLHSVTSVETVAAALGGGRPERGLGEEGDGLQVVCDGKEGWGAAMWQTAPAVWGYSFKVRAWGWTLMEGVRSIVWAPGALQALVIAPEHKEVLSAILPLWPGTQV